MTKHSQGMLHCDINAGNGYTGNNRWQPGGGLMAGVWQIYCYGMLFCIKNHSSPGIDMPSPGLLSRLHAEVFDFVFQMVCLVFQLAGVAIQVDGAVGVGFR